MNKFLWHDFEWIAAYSPIATLIDQRRDFVSKYKIIVILFLFCVCNINATMQVFASEFVVQDENSWTDLIRTQQMNAKRITDWNSWHHTNHILAGKSTSSNQVRSKKIMKHKFVLQLTHAMSLSDLHYFVKKYKIVAMHQLKNHLIVHTTMDDASKFKNKLINDKKLGSTIRHVETLLTFGKQSNSTPNDPLYSPYQWNLPAIHMPSAWKSFKKVAYFSPPFLMKQNDQSVIVAVVDSGVDLSHPDLKNHLVPGYNSINPSLPPNDRIGHGTHVSGIIAAATNNRQGVAGIGGNISIMPVKVLDDTGEGDAYTVAKGIVWASDHGAKVINLSLGDSQTSSIIENAINYARSKQVVIVAAAGNDGLRQADYPAAYAGVIDVGATNEWGDRAEYSNYGPWVDILAPGSHIASTFLRGNYASLSGTSMASPHVAAIAALICSQHPNWSAEQVVNQILLNATSTANHQKSRDPNSGYGLLNATDALKGLDWPNRLQFAPFTPTWITD